MLDNPKSLADIANDLTLNPHQKVKCPKCNTQDLSIVDVPFDKLDRSVGGQRFIGCSNCKDYEAYVYEELPDNWIYGMVD